MCRLFGYIGKKRYLGGYLGGNKNSLLSQSHGTGSPHGNQTIEHRDGWGMYWRKGNDFFYERRSQNEFEDNDFLTTSLEVKAELALGHIRWASKGTPVDRKNAQPIVGEDMVLAHNGTIYPYVEEGKPRRISDTQILFEKLSNQWQNRDYKSLVVALFNIMMEIGDNYTAINLLISNDKELFALCKFKEGDKFHKDYYTLWIKNKVNFTVVSSQQIDEDCFGWEKMENNTLVYITKNGIEGKTSLTK